MRRTIIKIAEDVNGEYTIREYLKRRLGFSTSLIAKVKYGGVFVNGDGVHMRHRVKNGDEIRVLMPTEESENIPPIDIPLSVIYEDEYILAVNKPRNMPVHPCRGNSLPTLANAVMAYIGTPFVFRAVNRLDRDTSGLTIVAKHLLSGGILSRQVSSRQIKRTYRAICNGLIPENGTIDAPIARAGDSTIERCVDFMARMIEKYGKELLEEIKVGKEEENGLQNGKLE